MGWACSTNGREKEHVGKSKVDVGGWIILVWILESWDEVMWTGLVWLRIGLL
jgi:hypothetical protein